MGNCLPRSCPPPAQEEQEAAEQVIKPGEHVLIEAKKVITAASCCDDDGVESGGFCRVKVLLTKGELEWLLQQLKEGGGREKRLVEDVLEEIERGRAKGKSRVLHEGWKPALESIVEMPELVAQIEL